MGFIKNFFANTRKPQGFLGKLMVGGMNKGHAKCADWGLDYSDVSVEKTKPVHRVLKPGGLFLIVNETDGEDAMGEKWEKMIDGMKLYKGAQLIVHLKNAGFVDVDMNCNADKHWLAVWGHRP